MNQFIVKKLWWENAGLLHRSSENIIIDHQKWIKQTAFVSAIRGSSFNTTDHLIQIANYCNEWNLEKAYEEIDLILTFHINVMNREFEENLDIRKALTQEITDFFVKFKKFVDDWYNQNDRNTPSIDNDYTIMYNNTPLSIIWFGEDVSAQCMTSTLNSKAQLLGLLEEWKQFAKTMTLGDLISPEKSLWKSQKEVFELLFERLYEKANKILEENMIPIMPWFVGSFPWWIENAVGRGYTDAAASALAVWYKINNPSSDVVLEIQKAVRWVLSADPGMLKDANSTQIIKKLDYITTKEIVGARGAQAKLLNQHALREELLEQNIRVHLFNPFDSGEGTWVSPEGDNDKEGVEFIGWRKNVYFVSISSAKMEQGFLKQVFQIVADYGSVDIVSTSETEITFTIDGTTEKDKIAIEWLMKSLGSSLKLDGSANMEFIEAINSKALVFCSWQNMTDRCWLLNRATTVLAATNINVEIISQWRLQRSIIFGISDKDLQKAIQVLHFEFIEKTDLQDTIYNIDILLEDTLVEENIKKLLQKEKRRLINTNIEDIYWLTD